MIDCFFTFVGQCFILKDEHLQLNKEIKLSNIQTKNLETQ